MRSPLYSLLAQASSLTHQEMEQAHRLLEAGDYDPNETHQWNDQAIDQRSLLECLARESSRRSPSLEQLTFFKTAIHILLEKGADPARTNAVGQTPDRLASDFFKRLLMKARGANYDQEQSLKNLGNLCRTLLEHNRGVVALSTLEKSSPFSTEHLGAPFPVAVAALAMTREAWAEKSPIDPKKMIIQTRATIRSRQMERLLKWIPRYVEAEHQGPARAVFQAVFKAAQQHAFYGWEDDAQAIWADAEARLFASEDWNFQARAAMDGRFGALTPHICHTVLFAIGPCTTLERTGMWLDAMAALSRCSMDERHWLEADNYRHLTQDSLKAIRMAWQPNTLLGAAPEWNEQTSAQWTAALTPRQGTELIVEIMATNTDGLAAEQFGTWETFLKGWLERYPDQAPRVQTIAHHVVREAGEKEAMRQRMRPLALEATLPAVSAPARKLRF